MLNHTQDSATAMLTLPIATLSEETLKTLRLTYVLPGDIFYIPYGSMVCEKALGEHNFALRVPMTLMKQSDQHTSFLFGHAARWFFGCNQQAVSLCAYLSFLICVCFQADWLCINRT